MAYWRKYSVGFFLVVWPVFSSFKHEAGGTVFPYAAARLTPQAAAAHMLSRFTYGATPGQVDEVVTMGLENWFNKQLQASLPDDSINRILKNMEITGLSNYDIIKCYPKNFQVVRMGLDEGALNKDSISLDKGAYRERIKGYMQHKGFRPEDELQHQFINQKILRAAYSKNQLLEVMTSFWFNHFNVSMTKNECSQYIPAYERDVIRPGALGKFGALLLATAKSPAMLNYLDNASSSASTNGKRGLNENYAREVMELHTLGVEGGYTQSDVTQAARVLTGWTLYPLNGKPEYLASIMSNIEKTNQTGRHFVREGDFLFNANRHDYGEKTVLGRKFGPEVGYEEGVLLFDLFAHHTSTAQFICRKLAVHFVSDVPPASLINKMVRTFKEEDGDIKKVLITLVSAPEFWSPAVLRSKTKTPFELAMSAVRTLQARVNQPYQVFNWINRMGEKIYYYQAPTGFPDKGAYWINSGSLLNRMNFGLAVASDRIPGLAVDLLALNHRHEPESSWDALKTYGKILMPERNLESTFKHLSPILNDPALPQKIAAKDVSTTNVADAMQDAAHAGSAAPSTEAKREPAMISQAVGILIGSPEYQRR